MKKSVSGSYNPEKTGENRGRTSAGAHVVTFDASKDTEMSYIDPKIRPQFESLSIDLKNAILEQNVQLYTLNDLIRVLENIVSEES